MGWLLSLSAGVAVLVSAVSIAGSRWNARGTCILSNAVLLFTLLCSGGVFAPIPTFLPASAGGPSWAVVTGANSGLGYEIARGLSKLGFSVLVGVRSLEAGEAAAQRIVEENPTAVVAVEVCESQVCESQVASHRCNMF